MRGMNYRQTNQEIHATLTNGLPYANPGDIDRLAAMLTMRVMRAYSIGREEVQEDFDTRDTGEFLIIEVDDYPQDSRPTIDLGPSVGAQ